MRGFERITRARIFVYGSVKMYRFFSCQTRNYFSELTSYIEQRSRWQVSPVSNRLSGIVPPPLVCDTFWKDSVGRSRNGFVVLYPIWLLLASCLSDYFHSLFNPFSKLEEKFSHHWTFKSSITYSHTWLCTGRSQED